MFAASSEYHMKQIRLLAPRFRWIGLALLMAGIGLSIVLAATKAWTDYGWPALLLILTGSLITAFSAEGVEDEWMTQQRLRAWGWSVLVVCVVWACAQTGLFVYERYRDYRFHQEFEQVAAEGKLKTTEIGRESIHIDLDKHPDLLHELNYSVVISNFLKSSADVQFCLLVLVFLLRFRWQLWRNQTMSESISLRT